ncbi:DUF4232 domain-containing protein [Streptomyces sp. NPDC004290]|uniref:DUF4232 domain-containing protein n=1 Tax=Streptomyces sp. NPDC014746 TaxID=3364904 RepID=UPI0036FC9953
MDTSACRDRGSTRGWKSCAAGAAVVAALLTSTACRSDGGGAAPTARPSTGAPATPTATATPPAKSGTPSATPGATTSGKPGGTKAPANPGGSPSATGGTRAVADCTTEQLAVSAVKEPADSKENRHLLLGVQNAGDAPCKLYRYPHVKLGATARTMVPVIEESDPDPGRPVVLGRGEEAYAALLVSGGGRDEYEATSITLTLQGRAPGSRAGGPVDVPLPVPRLYADDGQLVTYWTTASGVALDFIMSK